MRPKEYLKRIRAMDTRLEILIREREDLEKIMSICPENKEGQRAKERIEESEEAIARAIDAYIDYRDRALYMIMGLENDLYVKILFKRYFEYKTFETIAQEVYVSTRHATRLHGYALLELEEKLKEKA